MLIWNLWTRGSKIFQKTATEKSVKKCSKGENLKFAMVSCHYFAETFSENQIKKLQHNIPGPLNPFLVFFVILAQF
jgi:hypothetical protein